MKCGPVMSSAARASEILTDGLHLVIASRPVDLIRRITLVSRDAQHKVNSRTRWTPKQWNQTK